MPQLRSTDPMEILSDEPLLAEAQADTRDGALGQSAAPEKPAALDPRPALCLSGGGYRAMLFHIGGVLRLNECGLLSRLGRVSSVSGGSITAGMLAASWEALSFDQNDVATNLPETFVGPLLSLASRTIDVPNIALGLLPGISAPARVAKAYDKFLFGGKTLQDLPDTPVFVFNATNMRTGVLWRFLKAYAADYRIGMIRAPNIPLSIAVAASSAFPPILSPVKIDLSAYLVERTVGADLHAAPFTKEAALTDGGVYDNLGLETVYKRHKTVFVSNGGGSVPDFAAGFSFWSTQLRRIITIMNGQHDALRIRELIGAYKEDRRSGAYWGLNSRLNAPLDAGDITISDVDLRAGEAIRTRLNRFTVDEQKQLIRLGYLLCDNGLRSHFDPELPAIDLQRMETTVFN